jgi:hypothetical protein
MKEVKLGEILLLFKEMEYLVIVLLVIVLFVLIKKYLELRQENQKQKEEINKYQDTLKPIIDLDTVIKEKEEKTNELELSIKSLIEKYSSGKQKLGVLMEEVKVYEENIDLSEFGLYEPHFDFETSEKFKTKIRENKDKQKALIKAERAATCTAKWTVENSAKKGEMMTKRGIKLTLRAFNGECNSLIAKVNWNNANQTELKIIKAHENIDKLNVSNKIFIEKNFLDLKLEELYLVHELEVKKQDEKEEQRRIKEEMREEEKAQREIDKAKKTAEQETKRYEKALEQAQKDLGSAQGDALEKLKAKIAELSQELDESKLANERAISRAQMTKSGHVYVISNIGSFGENVYKIGMTRRLEPLDRVKELGDASVPFKFDVHAMIYTENAPELENLLHKEFNDRRVNRINNRKEYFNVTLNEIESIVHQVHGAEIEFTKLAEAQEYRETLTLQKQLQKAANSTEDLKVEADSKYPDSLF